MNAIDLLKEQHREVEELFEQLEEADDPEDKQTLFQALADNLAAHATIEEKIFYPAAYAKKTREILTEAVEEHLVMKRLIVDLLGMSPDHENFDAKLKVLQEQFEHHVEEEEEELLKAARRELGQEKLKTLGLEMKELFDEEMAGEPREAVADQLEEAASLP